MVKAYSSSVRRRPASRPSRIIKSGKSFHGTGRTLSGLPLWRRERTIIVVRSECPRALSCILVKVVSLKFIGSLPRFIEIS